MIVFAKTMKESLVISISGWAHLTKRAVSFLVRYFSDKSLPEKLLALLLLIQMVTSGMHWFSYKIQLFETPETVFISSKWNFFFILSSTLSFFWMVFWKSPWVVKAFYILQGLQICFLLVGFWNPSLVFTDLVRDSDYRHSIPFLFFSISLVLSTTVAAIHSRKAIA